MSTRLSTTTCSVGMDVGSRVRPWIKIGRARTDGPSRSTDEEVRPHTLQLTDPKKLRYAHQQSLQAPH